MTETAQAVAPVVAPRLPLAPLAAAVFTTQFGLGVAFPLVPLLIAPSGAGPAAVGAIFTAYACAMVTAQLIGGALADRVGAGRLVIVALGIYALGMAGYLITNDPVGLIVVRLVEGTGTGLTIPSVMALIARAGPLETRGKTMGIVLGIGGLGFIAGPALGGQLAPVALYLPFVAGVAVAGLAMIACMAMLPADPPAEPSSGGWRSAAAADARAIIDRLRTPAFLGAVAPLMGVKINFAGLQAGIPFIAAATLGASPAQTSYLFIITALTYIAVQPIAGRLADKFGTRSLLLGAFLGMAVLLAWQSQQTSYWGFIPGWILLSFLQTGGVTLALKHLADRVAPGQGPAGRELGLGSASADLGMVLAPALFLSLGAWHVEAILIAPALTILFFAGLMLALDQRAPELSGPANPKPQQGAEPR